MTKEETRAYHKAWRLANPDKLKVARQKLMDRGYTLEYRKKYNSSPEGKAKQKATQQAYYLKNKERIKARVKANSLLNKDKYASKKKLYRETHKKDKLSYDRLYKQTPRGKQVRSKAWNKRYRKLGFNPLNAHFEGSVGHHINDIDVIYIPEFVHVKYTGGHDCEYHRQQVLAHYGTIENMLNNQL